jgi:predicted house-cleaning NTP pyrophosphatase (Maf/HAM1 superfamily)
MTLASISLSTNDTDIIDTLCRFLPSHTYINPMVVKIDDLFEGEDGFNLSLNMARSKCLKAHSQLDRTIRDLGMGVVVGLDTMAILDGVFLSTPLNEMAQRDLLLRLSGKTHHIITSLYMMSLGGEVNICTNTTNVSIRDLTTSGLLDDYISTGEGLGRPAGYNISRKGISLISSIEGGDHTNVVGIPLNTLRDMLTELGFSIY